MPLPQPFFIECVHPESSFRETNRRFPWEATPLPERSHPGQGHVSMSSVSPGHPLLHTFSLPGAVSVITCGEPLPDSGSHPKAVSHTSPGPAAEITPFPLLPHCPPFRFVLALSAGTQSLCFRIQSTGSSPTWCPPTLFHLHLPHYLQLHKPPLVAQDPFRVILAKVSTTPHLSSGFLLPPLHQHTLQTCSYGGMGKWTTVAASPHHLPEVFNSRTACLRV